MKKILLYIAFGVFTLSLNACKKELGALPKNAKVDANTILDQGTAQIALNGTYYTFANATVLKTGWATHQTAPARLQGSLFYGFGVGAEDENRNISLPSYYWNESYILLNATNGLIKGVNALDDSKFVGNRKKEMLAEAKFLRAYAHFKLLNYYGEWYKLDSPFGVLLRDELSNLSNISKARSSVRESYDFILSDLNEVIANGPTANQHYYATKWAGMALKMRVLICRGAVGDYQEVISLANTLTQSGPYVLEEKSEDIFHKNGLTSKEIILGLIPQVGQEKDKNAKSATYLPGAITLYVATAKLKDMLANDPRQTWMIGSANITAQAPNTFYFVKHIPQNTIATVVSETDYALRLTEVYLLKAEAIVRSGGSLADARTVIHLVQSKSGINATVNNTQYLAVENAANSDALLYEIYRETVKCLIAEDGMEWLALLRLPFSRVRQIKPTITSQNQYILPVPKSEFIYNPIFGEQNPGYPKN